MPSCLLAIHHHELFPFLRLIAGIQKSKAAVNNQIFPQVQVYSAALPS